MIAITLDVDWAPDFAIDFAAEKLVKADIKATWFVTHASPAIDRLRDHPDLFELGIHPNFFPGSTHGATPEAVLDHCMGLVPDAISMRSHGTYQSARLLECVMTRTPVRADSSVFLPRAANVEPFIFHGENGAFMTRIPYVWEDDYEMRLPAPKWRPDEISNIPGAKVMCFHPIHIYLNDADGKSYRKLIEQSVGNLRDTTVTQSGALISIGDGPRTMFEKSLELTEGHFIRDFTIAGVTKE